MYKLNFVSDEDFERLPGKNMETKVGVAYPKYGEAYVRKTGVNVVDTFTAMHELEHLEGASHGESFDSDNGCYYKGFGDVMQNLVPGYGALKGNFAPMLQTAASIAGVPMLGNMFGGQGQSGRQSKIFNFDEALSQQMPQQQQMQQPSQPNVIQTQGAGNSGQGMGGSAAQPGAKTGSMDDALRQFGFYGGR